MYQFHLFIAEHQNQSWALAKYLAGRLLFLSTFSAYSVIQEAHDECRLKHVVGPFRELFK
jgi:hypothetical protein